MADSTHNISPTSSSTPDMAIKQSADGVKTSSIPSGAEGVTSTIMAVLSSPINVRLDALTSMVKEKLKPGLDNPFQEEMAKLLNLTPELANLQHERLIPLAEIAATALISDKPNFFLAKCIRKNIERRVHPGISAMFWIGSPPVRVILGLGALFYTATPLVMFLSWLDIQKEVLGIEISILILVAFAGALGSIVSIMVRIQDFIDLKNTDPSILFFTGFFKPIIGIAFALFVYAMLSSGLLPITIDPSKARYFFAALAFVSGFSERFAKDVATKAEQVVTIQSPTS